MTLVTGIICGAVAFFVTYYTKKLSSFKFKTFHLLLEKEKSEEIAFGMAYVFLFVTNIVFASVAWLAVYIEPLSAGSGLKTLKKIRLARTLLKYEENSRSF